MNTREADRSKFDVGANYSEIFGVITEYGIAKICSMLGIGPRILPWGWFDLVCYQDCIEFGMELCTDIT